MNGMSSRAIEVYEHPPNGQGFAALSMLNIMESFNFGKYSPLDAERYHTMIEAKKLAYADHTHLCLASDGHAGAHPRNASVLIEK